jgi:hypothetical protein
MTALQGAFHGTIGRSITPSLPALPGLQETVQGQFARADANLLQPLVPRAAYERRRWSRPHPVELLSRLPSASLARRLLDPLGMGPLGMPLPLSSLMHEARGSGHSMAALSL